MDAGIEIVDLVGERVEVGDPDKDVNSNEAERAHVDVTVRTDKTAAHEAHVGVVGQAVPRMSVMPTQPAKSVINDGSLPGPGNWAWNGVPGIVWGIGLGVPCPSGSALASAGSHRPAVIAAPPASAAVPSNLRRDTARFQKCACPTW